MMNFDGISNGVFGNQLVRVAQKRHASVLRQ